MFRKKERRAIGLITKFTKTLSGLISETDFGLVVVPGNSGLVMEAIARVVYSELMLPFPDSVRLAVSRGSGIDERLPVAEEPIPWWDSPEVLFLDDEIGTGKSLSRSIRAILPYAPENIYITAVAENMAFEWRRSKALPGAQVFLHSYARHIKGHGTNKISHVLRDSEFKTLAKYVPIHAEKKQILALLLSGRVKRLTNQGIVFDRTIEAQVQSRAGSAYWDIKKKVVSRIWDAVRDGIPDG